MQMPPIQALLRILCYILGAYGLLRSTAWLVQTDCNDFWSPPRYMALLSPSGTCYTVKNVYRNVNRKAQGGSFFFKAFVFLVKSFTTSVVGLERYLSKYEYHLIGMVLALLLSKDFFSYWADELGLGLGLSYINTALGMDGGDSEADLPDLDLVTPEEHHLDHHHHHDHSNDGELRLVSSGGKGDEGQLQESGVGEALAASCCEQCRELRGGHKDKPRPEGWLVFHKVYGVVPQEVLDTWRDEDKSRRGPPPTARHANCTANKPVERPTPPQPPPPAAAGSRRGSGCNGGIAKIPVGRERNHPRRLPPVRQPPL